ncbi:MAE_28990/MAE_18760 family HEPN-like nuclease [Streptomonospora alba]|uniref:MAE_28990/MAE_18760 family HEPN-like nuclease n=1 Tax=Streptomonospora alba TaxID=183763 RepID=UPI00147001D2|nr:MAE_28990/MAE_18760 family HEPN-like nuclease [Streptomonospora alba]
MTSTAWADLANRLAEIRLLSDLDPMRSGETSQPAVSNSINRSCIVLLSAHLEGFLEDIAAEAVDFLVANKACVDDLPIILRALHVEDHLRAIESIKDKNARAPKIKDMFASESFLWRPGATLEATMVRAKTVCSQMDNPGSREICQFLALLDVDILQHLEKIDRRPLLDRVNGLVARRNAIAHGEASASATHIDVDDYVALVQDLAREINTAVGQSVMRICKLTISPW